ncbi:hypothetical protein GALMADRAFT_887894 [Galerina marginata CBS 339.88]|uniref:Uncharacterized protein n=1 Tax=Galerina marginata (strain CBS 339.88) TaxID=685588 RepID=A0A067SGQ4_GALM3|nr:hypothetical protein GALMADRAFT_887894 [Galerina marginata CBS 339.88]
MTPFFSCVLNELHMLNGNHTPMCAYHTRSRNAFNQNTVRMHNGTSLINGLTYGTPNTGNEIDYSLSVPKKKRKTLSSATHDHIITPRPLLNRHPAPCRFVLEIRKTDSTNESTNAPGQYFEPFCCMTRSSCFTASMQRCWALAPTTCPLQSLHHLCVHPGRGHAGVLLSR